MRRRIWFSIIGVIAVAAIAIGINMFADARLANLHVDLTQRPHLHAVATARGRFWPTSRNRSRCACSTRAASAAPCRSTAPTPTTCARCWSEYAAVSDGKVRLEFYDPEPFSDTEDRALAYGLQGVPLDQGGVQVYFGLAGSNLRRR